MTGSTWLTSFGADIGGFALSVFLLGLYHLYLCVSASNKTRRIPCKR